MLVDLPTNDMQKSSNVMLEGIIESSSNPSTTLWNAVLPIIMTDCESREGTVGKYKYKLHIATVCADQPVMWVKQILMIENVQAKRSLFGMRAHHGSSSCFYCLSPGTFYKMEGESTVFSENNPSERDLIFQNEWKKDLEISPSWIRNTV